MEFFRIFISFLFILSVIVLVYFNIKNNEQYPLDFEVKFNDSVNSNESFVFVNSPEQDVYDN